MVNPEQKKRIILTAQEFIDAWNGGYKGVKEKDGKGFWEGEDILGNIQVNFKDIEVEVGKNIEIFNLKNLPNLKFSESKIGNIIVRNSKAGWFRVEKTIIGFFTIQNSKIDDIWINKNSITSNFNIMTSLVGDVIISSSNTGDLRFLTATINRFTIGKNSTIGKITLESTVKAFEIDFSFIKGDVAVNNSKIYNLKFQTKELRKVSINSSFIQNFNLNQDSFCLLTINNCELERVVFSNCIIPKDSVFQIADCSINSFLFFQFTNAGWLNLISLKPLTSYERFSENEEQPIIVDSKYQFERVENKDSILYFGNSDFGKTTFIDCLLERFDTFVFHNTKLLEVFSAGTELPKEITLPTFTKELIKAEQERLAFSQFKKIAENRGDTVQATEFLALEMEAYSKQIENNSSKWGEQFNLWLNKFSSNWGSDWVRAVFVTLGAMVIFYTAYCHALGYRMFGTDFCLFLDLASFSFEFLNPLRKADPLKDFDSHIKINWLARSIDYISRIFIAYFVYQTIQAFRRFGKKS